MSRSRLAMRDQRGGRLVAGPVVVGLRPARRPRPAGPRSGPRRPSVLSDSLRTPASASSAAFRSAGVAATTCRAASARMTSTRILGSFWFTVAPRRASSTSGRGSDWRLWRAASCSLPPRAAAFKQQRHRGEHCRALPRPASAATWTASSAILGRGQERGHVHLVAAPGQGLQQGRLRLGLRPS